MAEAGEEAADEGAAVVEASAAVSILTLKPVMSAAATEIAAEDIAVISAIDSYSIYCAAVSRFRFGLVRRSRRYSTPPVLLIALAECYF